MIERFGLGDSLIPRLRHLAQTVRSSRWKATLYSPTWGLTHQQAADLSDALLVDTQTSPVVVIMHKSPVSLLRFHFWTRFLSDLFSSLRLVFTISGKHSHISLSFSSLPLLPSSFISLTVVSWNMINIMFPPFQIHDLVQRFKAGLR